MSAHRHKHLQARANGPSTVYATVYTTMSATFTESIAGYSTMGADSDETTAAALPTTDATPDAGNAAVTSVATSKTDGTTLPSSVVPSSTADLSSETNLAIASSHSTLSTKTTGAASTGATASTAVAAAASSTSTASSTSSDSNDNSGAKAGIAFGVLGGLLVFGLLAWFLYNKRRKQMEEQNARESEKANAAMGGMMAGGAARPERRSSVLTTRTTATAPRLSLRPASQFMPNFGERRSSKGAAMALAMAAPSNNQQQNRRGAGGNLNDRPSTSQSSHQENPFGRNAEQLDAVSEMSESAAGLDLHPSNPFDAPEHVVGVAHTTDSREVSPISANFPAGAGAAPIGTALTRSKSTRKDAPQTLDLTKANGPVPALEPVPIPGSPAGTEFSMTELEPGQSPGPSSSAAAIAAAGGPPQSTVHRVQLDFKPTLDDEIELKAGQLVRMLHEYDDGWALCIRLDRSHQGVCPRTCLSTRPVKPRPAGPPGTRPGPPVNPTGRGPPRGPPGSGPRYPPGQRPMTPQGGPFPGGRPQSPAMMRPQSPAGMPRPQSPAGMGRPQSPGPRAQSPGPRQRGYSQSSANGPRHGAPGPSPMNPANGNSPPQQRRPMGPPPGPIGRKPVPGQAY